jgi:hypothetical protein
VEEQRLPTVLHEAVTKPPVEIKFTTVPSGTGLLKWSAKRTVNTVVAPSAFPASTNALVALNEKLSWSGIPVVIVSPLDWVVSVVPAVAPGVEAVTLTAAACYVWSRPANGIGRAGA